MKNKKQLGNGLQPGNLRQQIPKLKTSKIQIQGKKKKNNQKKGDLVNSWLRWNCRISARSCTGA